MVQLLPPTEVFELPHESPEERLFKTGYELPAAIRVARSPRGEILTFHEGYPVPRKGLPYPEQIIATNQVKRAVLFFFMPFAQLRKGLTPFLQAYLESFCRLSDSIYATCTHVPYFKKEYYNTFGRGLWDVISVFLIEIGITSETANYVGKIAATIFESEDAYRMPLLDVMNEFTKEEIVRSPSHFVDWFIKIFEARSDNNDVKGKLGKFAKIAKIILWIPKYRRAFRKAFQEVDMNLFYYDQFSYFWSLNKGGYKFHGRSQEDRGAEIKQRISEAI